MLGEWLTRCGIKAIVDSEDDKFLFGTLLISLPPGDLLPMIPTYWDKDGRSKNQGFDLIQRRRSTEEKW